MLASWVSVTRRDDVSGHGGGHLAYGVGGKSALGDELGVPSAEVSAKGS